MKTPAPQQSFRAHVIRQFKKNRLALVSFYVASMLALVAIFADFLANEKPLVARYQEELYFPVLREYAVELGISQWPQPLRNIDWKKADFDFAIWPPVPYLPRNIDFANAQSVGPFGEQEIPSGRWRHWFGTDEVGRDVLAGMIHGTRIAFLVGLIAMGIATFIGVTLGALAGYFGDDKLQLSRGRLLMTVLFVLLGLFYAFGVRKYALQDAIGVSLLRFSGELLVSLMIFGGFVLAGNVLGSLLKRLPGLGKRVALPMDIMVSRLIEIVVSIPRLFLIVSIVAIARPSIFLVMVVIGLTSWTGIARFIRAELLRVRSLEYIEAANALGFPHFRTLVRHAIPNALSPVLVAVAFGVAAAILIESTLSFLGLGVPAEVVTWGSLLSAARGAAQAWWLAVFPGIAIFVTVTVFNLIGEGLSDALDPRLKK